MAERHDGEGPGDTPSPRTTIVGGRPPEADRALPPVPTGIQRLLRLAAVDEAFGRALVERRGDLAEAAGVPLTPSERAVLDAVPAAQLLRMIAELPPPTARREFLRQGAASAVILLGGAAFVGSATTGCPPERSETPGPVPPAEQEQEQEQALGEEEVAPERPDRPPPPAGIRPDLPEPEPPEPEPPAPTPEPPPAVRPEKSHPTRGIRSDMPARRPAVDPWDDGEG